MGANLLMEFLIVYTINITKTALILHRKVASSVDYFLYRLLFFSSNAPCAKIFILKEIILMPICLFINNNAKTLFIYHRHPILLS